MKQSDVKHETTPNTMVVDQDIKAQSIPGEYDHLGDRVDPYQLSKPRSAFADLLILVGVFLAIILFAVILFRSSFAGMVDSVNNWAEEVGRPTDQDYDRGDDQEFGLVPFQGSAEDIGYSLNLPSGWEVDRIDQYQDGDIVYAYYKIADDRYSDWSEPIAYATFSISRYPQLSATFADEIRFLESSPQDDPSIQLEIDNTDRSLRVGEFAIGDRSAYGALLVFDGANGYTYNVHIDGDKYVYTLSISTGGVSKQFSGDLNSVIDSFRVTDIN